MQVQTAIPAYLTSISVTTKTHAGHVSVLESLTFQTKGGPTKRVGTPTGSEFKVPIETGKVVGFYGRATRGQQINAIGVHVIPVPN